MNMAQDFIFHWRYITLAFCILVIGCLSCQLSLLPVSSIYLITYFTCVAFLSTWISFVTIQSFLQKNKLIVLPKIFKIPTAKYKQKKVVESLQAVKRLVVEIDENFINKWFIYISQDPTFNNESRILLEDMVKKLLDVQLTLDYQIITHGIFNLYLKHLKEFRRSLKRRAKYSGKIEDLYQYSHVCSSSKKAKNYFIHQLTIHLLNHFINWELSNSLPYHILTAIISKKVVLYILNLLSNPEFVNYHILMLCASEKKINELNLRNYNRVQIMRITETGDLTPTDFVKCDSTTNLIKNVDITSCDNLGTSGTSKIGNETLQDFQSEDVKIYEPRSCKTWYGSLDLTSIPLGQDILDTLNIEENDVSFSTQEKDVISPITSARHLLDEVKHITNFEGFKTSIKPISEATVHNFKDLQESTVNNVVKPVSHVTSSALHKIGGLHLQDEAAGVVEGILDFGRTRIRKGLKLTGLQDSPPEEGIKPPIKKQITKMPPVKSQDKIDEFETTWINPIQEESAIVPKSENQSESFCKIPSITTQSSDGSPELEYEETADLATSIAKLRSLLEQKSSESSLSTPALSPMPTDEMISNKILLEHEDVDEADGMMPSFYKFWAKTATGVIHNTLNTLKTALPGSITEVDGFDGGTKWLFIEANSKESDLSVRMEKLLHERKVFCTVDTAYEAIDSFHSFEPKDPLRQQPSIQFEDDLDDFEAKIPITKILFDILCELLADNKETSMAQEPVVKSILLLFGNNIEENIVARLNHYSRDYCANATILSESKIETLTLEFEEFIDVVLSGISDHIKTLFGEKSLRQVVDLFVLSIQNQQINQDLVLQIFEILSVKLMDGSKQLSPISA